MSESASESRGFRGTPTLRVGQRHDNPTRPGTSESRGSARAQSTPIPRATVCRMPIPLPPPILLPTPHTVELLGGKLPRPAWLDVAAEDLWLQSCGHIPNNRNAPRIIVDKGPDTLAPHGYNVLFQRDQDGQARICVYARSREGLRSGAATLRQLCRAYPAPHDLPCLRIEDSPSGGFATRGVMLDVSRDKVPTMAHLRSTIDLLASLKFNHLQLYTEHAPWL